MNIKQALATLDPENDGHWTADGLPRMDVIAELVGNPAITRAQVTTTAPAFTRATAEAHASTFAEELATSPPPKAEPVEPPRPPAGPRRAEAPRAPAPKAELEPELEGPDMRVLELEPREVLANYDLSRAALEALTAKHVSMIRKLEDGKAELAKLNGWIETVKRAIQQHERTNPSIKREQRSPVQAYLEATARTREARAERTRVFLDAGTTPGAVAAALGPSPLDRALSARPGRGRPAVKPVTPLSGS